MVKRKQFTFYRSFFEAIGPMKASDRLALYDAIVGYGLDGCPPKRLSAFQTAIFSLIKPVLDSGKARALLAQSDGQQNVSKTCPNADEGEIEKEKEFEIEYEGDCRRFEAAKADFESFWKEYPRKIRKDRAFHTWLAYPPDVQEAMEGLTRWKKSQQWQEQNGRFIPLAWRWIKEKHYLDTPQPKESIWGCSGNLGNAELEAIARIMREDES